MATHTVKLQARQPVAEGTMAFHLEKPAGFEFRPGQALEVILPGGAEGEEGRHPFGSLILHKKAERAGVLVAGGIGITPFMSMLRNAAEQHSEQSLVLLYSNRRPEDAAFLAELQALAQRHPKFRLVATMTGMARSQQAWDGATGYIDGAFVRRAIEGLPAPIFYVSGPPALVEAMRGTLVDDAGVDEDDVRSEEFYGY